MDKAILHRVVNVDENYFKVLDIDLIAGRDFIAEKDTFSFASPEDNIIVNEESLKVLNISLEDAIGSAVFAQYNEPRKYTIIGVAENFHQFSLHQPILPMLFLLPAGRTQYAFVAASIEGNNHEHTIEQMNFCI
jgi:putative ABC transport system permease protein